jgi:polyhydroxyalkanoate synthesis regulator phasin
MTQPISLTQTQELYGQSLLPLHHKLQTASSRDIDADTINLVSDLIDATAHYDVHMSQSLLQQPYLDQVARNLADPSSYSHPILNGQIWADNPTQPLQIGESWNHGRRATNIQVPYALDQHNLPVNPYMNFGIHGRGIIGRFGPNHAVDDGILRIMPDENGKPILHALGIIRHDNGKPALCGGFSNFTRQKDGAYRYGFTETVQTQTQEFIEELVSGSIELLPSYATGLDDEIAQKIQAREQAQGGTLAPKQIQTIQNELTTHRKIAQITEQDPLFVERVAHFFQQAQPCYAGPVLSSPRNTNTAWMETRLSWNTMDESTWNTIKGHDKFGYNFKAGDDAQQVFWHPITPRLMSNASESHGAFFSYLLSAYLLTTPPTDKTTLQSLQDQAVSLLSFTQTQQLKTTAPTVT